MTVENSKCNLSDLKCAISVEKNIIKYLINKFLYYVLISNVYFAYIG